MQMQNFEDRTFSKGSRLQGRIFNMNKQALRKTGFFLKGKGNYMNRTSQLESWWLCFKKKYYLERKWIIRKNAY